MPTIVGILIFCKQEKFHANIYIGKISCSMELSLKKSFMTAEPGWKKICLQGYLNNEHVDQL